MASTSPGNPHNHRPSRELRPDETFCWQCARYFLGGELFEAHRARGFCIDPINLGWVQDGKGAWGYKAGTKASVSKPRRTNAQASFGRLVAKLPARERNNATTKSDIEKVSRVLERDRDSK